MGKRMFQTGKTVLAAGLALLVLACAGGGGGGSTGSPSPVTAVPVFTLNPSNLAVQVGTTASFSASASGTPTPTFQWERSADGLTWLTIPGATLTGYTFMAQASDQQARFRAIASNSAGSATSNPATLTVSTTATKPTITSFTATPSTVAAGSSSTLAWVVSGATSLSISPTVGTVTGTSVSVTPSTTTTYILTATNTAGSSTANATVTLSGGGTAVAPAFTTQPVSRTVAPGASVTFSVVATGTPAPTYQWYRSPNGTTWTAISGAAGASFTLVAQTSDNGAQFQARASNSAGTVPSNAATLSVQTTPGTGNVTVTLYGTTAPAFIAVQDGNGSWQPFVMSGSTSSFPVTAADGRFGIAFGQIGMIAGSPSYSILMCQTTLLEHDKVEFGDEELPANALKVSGTLSGFQTGEVHAELWDRDPVTTVSLYSSSPNFSYTTVSGTHDLVVVSKDSQMATKRIAVRRNLAITSNTTLPHIDLNAEALQPTFLTINTDGTLGGIALVTPNGHWLPLDSTAVAGGAFRGMVLAPSQRNAQDLYLLNTNSPDGRWGNKYSDLSGTLSVTLGELLGPTSVGFASGNTRLQAHWPAMSGAAEYSLSGAQMLNTGYLTYSVVLTPGWLGTASSYTYAQPDLSELPGLDARWKFSNGPALNWYLSGGVGYSSNNSLTLGARYDYRSAKAGDYSRGSYRYGTLAAVPAAGPATSHENAMDLPLPKGWVHPWGGFRPPMPEISPTPTTQE